MENYLVYNINNSVDPAQLQLLNPAIVGGKGASLATMMSMGLPVPECFIISSEAGIQCLKSRVLSDDLKSQILSSVQELEKNSKQKFGCKDNPLIVSVRSGAKISMPGMMDTILNLGLNDETVEGLARKTNNEKFALDSYRRFIQMYASIVLEIPVEKFEGLLDTRKRIAGLHQDNQLSTGDLRLLIEGYKGVVNEHEKEIPQNVEEQLLAAVSAVFNSWDSDRAIEYRRIYNIDDALGTAVNVQRMVFGNMNNKSMTGVCFTRNPSTGDKEFFGEYLVNAQGEDIVAGIRTPLQLTRAGRLAIASSELSMEEENPELFKQLFELQSKIEMHYRDMQDIEFTVEDGALWILQARSGKRTAHADVKIAVDMVHEGMLTKEEAIMRVVPSNLVKMLHPVLDENAEKSVLCNGLPASPGAVSGKVCFNAEDVPNLLKKSKEVILVRYETSPQDVVGMELASGILTARGGMTSHAAVIARGMGKPCVVGASCVLVNSDEKYMSVGDAFIREGDTITINGCTGEVVQGSVPTIQPNLCVQFKELLEWVDDVRTMKVRANAETVKDVKGALSFGAEGIGLCRTEHMFFDSNRINIMRQVIIGAKDKNHVRQGLKALLEFQKKDFIELFKIMKGLPVNIRLLDPPFHEFLSLSDKEISQIADSLKLSKEEIKHCIASVSECNPMLGNRGCRLAMTFPEIYEMQVTAIFEALVAVDSSKVELEIMIPFVISARELEFIRNRIDNIALQVKMKYDTSFKYKVGTMIELPKAALEADLIAQFADFMSFGTNDLTQTTLGISRDDTAHFMDSYIRQDIFKQDPFVVMDSSVKMLLEIAAYKLRETKSQCTLSICGEHGGDPESIQHCQAIGLDYVSCSPYRVPITKVAAAQSAIMLKTGKYVKGQEAAA